MEAALSLLADLSTDAAHLAENAAPRIVAVAGANGRFSSGFIWRTGLVVTAEEVLEGEDEVMLHLAAGSSVKATLAGRDPSTDVALLRAETADFPEWAQAESAKPASLALVVGRTERSLVASLTSVGELGAAWRSMRGGMIDSYIGLTLRLTSRTEGAAVVSPDGRLIGMAVSSPQRRTLVIPATTISRVVTVLNEKGYVARGWLGVMLQHLPQGGAMLLNVDVGSPAANAGLLPGDIITTWNGEPVRSPADVARRLGTGTVGEKITLGVSRGGNTRDVDVTLGERPRA